MCLTTQEMSFSWANVNTLHQSTLFAIELPHFFIFFPYFSNVPITNSSLKLSYGAIKLLIVKYLSNNPVLMIFSISFWESSVLIWASCCWYFGNFLLHHHFGNSLTSFLCCICHFWDSSFLGTLPHCNGIHSMMALQAKIPAKLIIWLATECELEAFLCRTGKGIIPWTSIF